MPRQRPGASRQDYETPEEFLHAVKGLLGIEQFWRDLAATEATAKSSRFYSMEESAFMNSWNTPPGQWNWCNPPFSNIEPWVRKAWFASQEIGDNAAGSTAVLVPGSIGTLWWQAWVYRKGLVLAISPRLTFVGEKDPYPKDLALVLYGQGPLFEPGFRPWRWR